MFIEVNLKLNDGSNEWISPVEDVERDITQDNKIISVNNGYHTYTYEKSKIKTGFINYYKEYQGELIESRVIEL